jgi:hypothetical protein
MRRRSFVSAATLGAAGLAAPSNAEPQDPAQEPAGARRAPRHRQDAWFDALPGRHRLFVDATTVPEAASALSFAWNFLRSSQTGYNLKDADQAVIVGLRHYATEVSFSNDVWRKYEPLRTSSYVHPDSGTKVTGVNIFRPDANHALAYAPPFTLDGLVARGVHVAVCGLAARSLARRCAGARATPDSVEAVLDEMVKSMPANAHVMASGILAAQRAGEYGYTVIRA